MTLLLFNIVAVYGIMLLVRILIRNKQSNATLRIYTFPQVQSPELSGDEFKALSAAFAAELMEGSRKR